MRRPCRHLSLCIVSSLLPVARGRSNQPEFGDQARGVAGQCLEDIPTLLPGARENGSDHGKVLRAALTAEAAGDLLPEFHRSEEHTSELQSRQYLVCRLLLE